MDVIIISFCVLLCLFSEETENEQALIAHVCMSIERAEKHLSRLYEDVLQIDGMSSAKVRHFLNNLCSKPNTHYLEIGVWKGSTFLASLFKIVRQ